MIFKCPIRKGLLNIGYRSLGFTDPCYERTIWDVDGNIIIRREVNIGMGSRIIVHGTLDFEDGFTITGESSIICMNSIHFGHNVLISWKCQFLDSDFHTICYKDEPKANICEQIVVGNNIWIGNGCNIYKGAVIPDGCVIAANSKITRNLEDSDCLYGNNNKLIKRHITWKQ